MYTHDQLIEEILQQFEVPGSLLAAERSLHEEMAKRQIQFGDGPLPTLVTPFMVSRADLDTWRAQSETLASQIESVAAAALEDRELYAQLGLSPEARELVEIDPGYKRITSISRPDAIVRRDRKLVFVEFNCDSPAMMSFADALTECLLQLDAYAPFRDRLPIENLTGALLTSLLECWREFGGGTTSPSIAITDWQGQKTSYEHRRIAAAFNSAGCPTVICDPRAFRRDGKALEVDGRRIDVVYRRALFSEILSRQNDVAALLGAYRDGAVCMVNSLRSALAGPKTLLVMLGERYGVTDVASTRILTPARIEALRSSGYRNVVKRGDSHGGLHVLLPGVTSEADWVRGLAEAERDAGVWVEQELHAVPTINVIGMEGGQPVRQQKFFNWNPFMFGGRYAGGIARVSSTPLINITLGGGLLPTWPIV